MTDISKVTTEKFSRSFSIRADETQQIDVEARTVEVAFSSEEPVPRWFGKEILDHTPSAIDLGRLRSGGAVLVDHDPTDQVGVVESVRIDSDRKGRAVLRFGRSARANEIFQDITDGIRSLVSVGYSIQDIKLESQSDKDGDTYRVTRWMPYEISIVSIPADTSVGVGRGIEKNTPQKSEVKVMDHIQTPAVNTITAEEAQRQERAAAQAERARVKEILAIGNQFELGTEAQRFIDEGHGVDAFRQHALQKMAEQNGRKPGAIVPEVGLDERDIKEYRITRAISAIMFPNDKRIQDAAGFEREVSYAAAQRAGFDAKGIFIPPDVMKRDLNVTTATAGGNTVQTNVLLPLIELLRNRLVMGQVGATMLGGLQGNVAIPRQSGAGTAYWIATEGGAPTESQQTIAQVALSPKTLGAFTDYTRQLMLQSSIDVEAFVRNDLARILAQAIDLAALYGTAADGQPRGVANTSGINTDDLAAAMPTFAELVGLETMIAADNADVNTMAYVIDPTVRGHCKTTAKFGSGTEATIWEPGNTINGYNAVTSNQVTAEDIFFGDWSQLLIGMWGGLDIMLDPYALSTSGGTRIVALQSVDVAVRNAVAFAYANDAIA